ncbi:MAG: formate--tetrahydrofolate ligase [Proteobacteria bacterium]|nr:formate--tetrahydrofolate ligase [Pseudomonadota bacterium]MDA0958553.1 formate--tetrahydrofolate ligase [Pseudomonadota bacterium]
MQGTDIEIARNAPLENIAVIGERLGIPEQALLRYGHHKAKIDYDFIAAEQQKTPGKLILVTAVSPTPAGEGKTTTTIGLGDALNRIGKKTVICLREPSLGPCFGMKGGAAGGGYAQVVPMEDINLHFTGDFHAIGAAHNLLAALIDNHIHWGNTLGIDPRRIYWRRVMDMNERALRNINIGLGGPSNGVPRESGFDITVASEIMAIFCLSNTLEELQENLGRIVIGENFDGEPVHASDLEANGAMSVLLKDAFKPNLVQTLEHNPALIHGGPFANIAHGCNSVIATRAALSLGDYVVTEAGFGAELGAEKFFNIKCRKAGLQPAAAVIVATVRALKMHGGVTKNNLKGEDVAAVDKGAANLSRHIRNMGYFGLPVVVAINRFDDDTQAEIDEIRKHCAALNVDAIDCTHWSQGGAGAEALANAVVSLSESSQAQFRTLYEDDLPLWDKIERIAQNLYGADEIIADQKVRNQIKALQKRYGHFPICMAKTQYSFSTDPRLRGAPNHHSVPIREVRLANGAGFIVVVCGDIMTMPGLPRSPAANAIRLSNDGDIEGLF